MSVPEDSPAQEETAVQQDTAAQRDEAGFVRFVQYHLPALGPGDFTLTATQEIDVRGQGESFQAVQSFHVKGIRYQLDDGGVDSVFPPSGSQGEFTNVLPHVVLTEPTLPWQRSPALRSPSRRDAAAWRAEAADGTPLPTWLAVLLFDEEDPPPKPQAKTLGDLLAAGGTFIPPRTSEYGEKASDPVTVIDVPFALYAQITPSLADLAWLAHVRQATPAAKATTGDAAPQPEVAVVFGNRLPAPGRTSTAFLVSLEGYGPYLPSDDGVAPDTIPAKTTKVRLVVLRSWTFSTIQLKQSFQGTLTALDMNPATLRMPGAALPPGDPVAGAFGMGYTAMDHQLRDGSRTVSWYRGPLLPLGVTAPPLSSSQTSDQLLRYDPRTGMFDVSYSAAWELGRLLALHDRAFATALFRWKLTVTQQAATALEEEIVDQTLPPLPDPGQDIAALPPGHQRLARVIRDVVGPAVSRLARPGTDPAGA
jgi:hypothetical protein